jgi:hypothetical protein
MRPEEKLLKAQEMMLDATIELTDDDLLFPGEAKAISKFAELITVYLNYLCARRKAHDTK